MARTYPRSNTNSSPLPYIAILLLAAVVLAVMLAVPSYREPHGPLMPPKTTPAMAP